MKPKTRPSEGPRIHPQSGGPRIYPLPQSPTGWNQAYEGERASVGGPDADPERPAGVLGDAGGLPAATDRARLARRGKRQKR